MGSFVDKGLLLVNSGRARRGAPPTGACPLQIFGVSSTLADFMVPAVASYPLTVFSDDPAGPATVFVTGTAPPPRLSVSIADSGDSAIVHRVVQ